MKEYEILEKAAEVVEKQGWVTGEIIQSPTGSVCAIGALGIAQGYDPHELANGNEYGDPPEWEDVVAAVPSLIPVAIERWLEWYESGVWREDKTWVQSYVEPFRDGVIPKNEAIYLYNDDVCTGGPELAEMFRSTARKLRANEKSDCERV